MTSEKAIILEAKGLRKAFGGLVAVDDVDIQIREFTLHSIIGPNGAGKTTLFNLLSGVMPPTRGKVFFRGEDITHLPPHRMAHIGLGRSYQITNIFPNLTVLENVRLAAQAMGHDNFKLFRAAGNFSNYREKSEQVLEQVGLKGKEGIYARTLSHGDKRKLELGIMLASDPQVLLLDEPTAGMSSEQVPELMKIIQGIREHGDKTIVLVEHRMDIVMQVSDVITVVNQGQVLAEGSPREIAANKMVQSAYLGDLYGDLTKV